MPKVVSDSWLIEIRLAWKVFINIPFHEGVRIPRLPSKNFEM